MEAPDTPAFDHLGRLEASVRSDILAKLRKEAKALAKARTARDHWVDTAVTEGVPLRTVAEAAGVSHQTVVNIIERLARDEAGT